MGLFEHLNQRPSHVNRGILTGIPQPPSEISSHNYLVDSQYQTRSYAPKDGSIEKSSTNFIKAATRTPVPPFAGSVKALIPPQDPNFSPPRTTMKLSSPRWQSPQVRDANSMHFQTSISAEGTFFLSHAGSSDSLDRDAHRNVGPSVLSNGTMGGSVISPLAASAISNHSSSPRRGLHTPTSQGAASVVSGGVASVVLSQRSPRYANTKFTHNTEGALIMHPIAAVKESRSLETLASSSSLSSAPSPTKKRIAVTQDFNKIVEKELYTQMQREFDRTMHGSKCVVMDLGLQELKLRSQKTATTKKN
ncbi:Hypothetical protein, putative [Bodo saltans]|uniref:Uncharacterized protein n=1 Tax=Bodo saltans TaxID=75058 RepID=A0A0S4IKM2_BODSA|nr:Hypothetical protein, putative [Bodo saltans]|eukprot:CUF10940.1 Hypothetical protein, putative [Bodo saltans]